MIETFAVRVARELGIQAWQVEAVESLMAEGATVPFIARYRKERTGSLDEVLIASARDRLEQLGELEKRREAIIKSLEERGLLTEELGDAIASAETMAALEDVYLPFRPKRRTRASVAREKGLEPLAQVLFQQDQATQPVEAALAFVCEEKGIGSAEEALAGARDIIAEWVSEDANTRRFMRLLFSREGMLRSSVVKGKDSEGATYRDYFDYEESVAGMPGHRVLAVFRGESEGYLKLAVRPSEDKARAFLVRRFVKERNPAAEQVAVAVEDSYKRLLAPSIETDIRREIKTRADDEAVRVFAGNLRELLMAPPLGQKVVLALDPGFRTGCKAVCLGRQGELLDHVTVFPTQSVKQRTEASKVLLDLIRRHGIEAIAIGNGTASRETEAFVRQIGKPETIPVVLVDESGASVYSASEAAREEFPEYDVTVRGAISIGRRLMDPLAELVKIDPRSIGVGQYQHDVDHDKLERALEDVVVSCVNGVGVELNTASKQLLHHVSGIGPVLGKSIVEHRIKNGPFRSREELKRVPRLGPKAFEQAAGFLRIRGGENPLDASAIHPENYATVERMAGNLRCSVLDIMNSEEIRTRIDIGKYVSDVVAEPTLRDIMEELARPGRDPRKEIETFAFADGIESIDDLQPGMRLPGVVTNVATFGAFVDIGVHHDGLVHISELADRFVRNPADVVRVHQRVHVTVLNVDRDRSRIALSLRDSPRIPPAQVQGGCVGPAG